jgi:iron(III) transport system substrate-binding protein
MPPRRRSPLPLVGLLAVLLATVLAGCSDDDQPLTVYSGRTEDLIGPVLDRFEEETGVEVEVRYGDGSELAGTILEEGDDVEADVFIAQDAGSLGALAKRDLMQPLPEDITDRVPEVFRSPDGLWTGLSARARVVVYDAEEMDEGDLPDTIAGFTDPAWRGRLGWAPTNASFQSFVTAYRVMEGEDAARAWLEGILANDPRVFPNNVSIVEAVAAGELDAGFVNHYYLFQLRAQGRQGRAENKYYATGDPGSLVNVAGAGILDGTDHEDDAERLVTYLLSEDSQRYFADVTHEVPVVAGVPVDPVLPTLDQFRGPEIDLGRLDDLEGTIDLLTDVGVL